jgi:hypothetical protein
MNSEFVSIGIHDDRCPAAGQLERFMSELYFMISEMLYRFFKVLYFQLPTQGAGHRL